MIKDIVINIFDLYLLLYFLGFVSIVVVLFESGLEIEEEGNFFEIEKFM